MNITELRQILDALQSIANNEENPMDTREAINLLQSKLAECTHSVDEGACKECYNVHTDHPMRHYDRACPACQKDDVEPLPDEWPLEFREWYRTLPDQKAEELWPLWSAFTHPAKKPLYTEEST